MRNLALVLAWAALTMIAWRTALALGVAMLFLLSAFAPTAPGEWPVVTILRGAVRTVKAAYAMVRRRRAAAPRGVVSVGFDVASPLAFAVTEWHEREDGVRVIDALELVKLAKADEPISFGKVEKDHGDGTMTVAL